MAVHFILSSCNSAKIASSTVLFQCKSPANIFKRLLSTPSSFIDDEFKPLSLTGKPKQEARKKREAFKIEVRPPRYIQMPLDQDWSSVWPTARTFHPAVVPFPVWQGYVEKGAPPGKFANAELMKIPNFLHLTPPAIDKHCEALKKFCTPWPKGLENDEKCAKHFPLEIMTSDYCHAGPSIRDPRSRVVTLKFKISALNLDYHARDKFLRLIGDRYDKETDTCTIVTDRCPLKKQNVDYAMYLLTALFFESWKFEPWESEKTEADMEKYFWEGSESQANIIQLVTTLKHLTEKDDPSKPLYLDTLSDNPTKQDILNLQEIQEYARAVIELHNEGENDYTINQYRQTVCRLLNIDDEQDVYKTAEVST